MKPSKQATAILLSVMALCASACGAAPAAHVRFAHASRSDLDEARSQGRAVWYDFEAGDEVPMVFALVGVGEAITDQPARLIAHRPFSIVMFPDGRMMFSFDGRSLTSPEYAARWSMVLDADQTGQPRAGLVVFIGERQDMPAEMQR